MRYHISNYISRSYKAPSRTVARIVFLLILVLGDEITTFSEHHRLVVYVARVQFRLGQLRIPEESKQSGYIDEHIVVTFQEVIEATVQMCPLKPSLHLEGQVEKVLVEIPLDDVSESFGLGQHVRHRSSIMRSAHQKDCFPPWFEQTRVIPPRSTNCLSSVSSVHIGRNQYQ